MSVAELENIKGMLLESKFDEGGIGWRTPEREAKLKRIMAAVRILRKYHYTYGNEQYQRTQSDQDPEDLEWMCELIASSYNNDPQSLQTIAALKLDGRHLNNCIDIACQRIEHVLEDRTFLETPPVQRRKPLSELLRRRRMLKAIGLKGGTVTEAKADAAFFSRYQTTFAQVLDELNVHDYELPQLILTGLRRYAHERIVFLFPLTGQLFNYYVARGLLEEMRRDGLGKGISVVTIQTHSQLYRHGINTIDAGDTLLREQTAAIFKRIKRAVLVDYISSGETQRQISAAAHDAGIIDTIQVNEHQELAINGKTYNPNSFIYKLRTGQMVPKEQVERYPQYTIQTPKDRLYIEKTDRLPDIDIKEFLTIFGRIYYRLHR